MYISMFAILVHNQLNRVEVGLIGFSFTLANRVWVFVP